MLLRTYSKLSALTAAGALAALLSGGAPVSADDNKANLGPVGPHEPILAKFGGKRVIAYYEPNGDDCEVSAIVFDASAAGGGHASTRIRVSLRAGEIFNLDAVEDERVMLTCGPNASMMTVLNRGEILTKAASVN
jgi:hypothetical protein